MADHYDPDYYGSRYYPKDRSGQQRLFDAGEYDYHRHDKSRRAQVEQERAAGKWAELLALWAAVKDMDIEDAAEMLYDFVREEVENES